MQDAYDLTHIPADVQTSIGWTEKGPRPKSRALFQQT